MTEILNKEFSRKSFVKGGGALVVGFSLGGAATAGKAAAAASPAGYNPPLNRIDSWLRVNADNTINLLVSQGEVGQGISTGFMMIAAEELDVEMSQMIYGVSVRAADGVQLNSVNDTYQVALVGGIGGSNSMSSTGHRIRGAAVAARTELLRLASANLAVPVSSLTVSKGVVSGGGKSVTYGQLLGGKLFNVTMPANPTLQIGAAPAKPVSQYKLVGTKVPRVDIPGKVSGRHTYVHNIKLPGMLHGRIVRLGQGPWLTEGFSKPLSVDASSIKHLPKVQIVHEKDFLGVVGPVEYEVVQAAAQLKVKWAESPILPGHGNLFKSFREADSAGKMPARITMNIGNFDNAFRASAKTVAGSFKYPYHGHTPLGPAAAVADYRHNGGPDKDTVVIYSNTQNIANTVTSTAATLGLRTPAQVRSIFYEGSSSFGNGYHYLDINDSAAILSRAAKAPVRMQLMRWDEQGWNKYGPAIMLDMRGGVDARGNIVAFEATAFAQAGAGNSAAKQLLGDVPAQPGAAGTNAENLLPMYKVAENALGGQGYRLIAKTQTQAMGMFQNGPLRAPSGPQTSFAAEQFVDILSIAANMDPYTFRIQNMNVGPVGPEGEWQRYSGVLTAAVEAAKASPFKYVPHVSGSQLQSGNKVSGWGMAVGTHNDSYGAGVAYVTVDKTTGKVTINHLWAGQDSGFAINPDLLMNQMSGNLIQGASKLLHEELAFDKKRVTSRDWVTYPILRFKDTPTVTTVLVNRTDRIASGSGEPPLVPIGAAIANAIFDATGVRMTHAPLTPARVRGFLRNAGK
jgi:CO/xanthine dehydrogenase Mo-binding subunit